MKDLFTWFKRWWICLFHGTPQQTAIPSTSDEQDQCWQAAQDEAAAGPGHEWTDGRWTIKNMLAAADEALTSIQIDGHRFAWLGRDSGLSVIRADAKLLRTIGPLVVWGDVKDHDHDGDRVAYEAVDMRFGLPGMASVVLPLKGGDANDEWQDMEIITVQQLDKLPIGIWATGDGWPFQLSRWHKWKKSDAATLGYVTIDRDGKIYPCRHLHHTRDVIRSRRDGVFSIPVVRQVIDRQAPKDVAIAISAWKTQGFHWLVRFSDSRGSVRFAVRPELIRRLFAKRDSVQGTSRRAAILHWVRAHYRHGKSGVKTHLRGALKFTMRGFDIEIMVPGRHIPEPQNINMVTVAGDGATTDPAIYRLLAAAGYGVRLATRAEVAKAESVDANLNLRPCRNARALSTYYSAIKSAAVAVIPAPRESQITEEAA